MARYTGSLKKSSHAVKAATNKKSARRSFSSKCKSEEAPGQHGRTSGARLSDYGQQLREKQKLNVCTVLERQQFRLYFEKANSMRGNVGEQLLGFG